MTILVEVFEFTEDARWSQQGEQKEQVGILKLRVVIRMIDKLEG